MSSKKQNKKHGREPGKQKNELPQWQPISMMAMIASIIDMEVENFEDLSVFRSKQGKCYLRIQ